MTGWSALSMVRWEATRRLAAAWEAHPSMSGVRVYPGWPGDKANARSVVWADELDGELDVPVSKGGRVARADEWVTTWGVRVLGERTVDGAMTRLMELIAAAEQVLAEDHTLDGCPGVLAATVTGARQTAAATPEGVVAFGELDVTTLARLY